MTLWLVARPTGAIKKRQHNAAAWVFHSDQKNRKQKYVLVLGLWEIAAKIVDRTARTSLGAEAAGGACTFRLFDFLGRQHTRALATQYTV